MKKLKNTEDIINAIQSSLSKSTNMRVFPQTKSSSAMSKSASRKVEASIDKEAIDMETGFDKTASIDKTASFEMGNVNTMFYSPRLTPDTWYLPRSRKMLLKWVDIFFDWDPYIYSILMMHSRYPIGNFNLICDEKEEQFFNEVLHNEQWDILDVLREGSISFTKYGECVVLGDWDSEHGVWKGFSWIDPGLIEVKEVPFTGKVKIFLEIPSKYIKAIKGKSKADEIERKLMPQYIVEAVEKGLKYIELDNEEGIDEETGKYSPPKVCMMVNKTNVGEKGLRGLPPMTPTIKCVAGDTKIALLDGSTPTVKELYDNNVQNIELYNIDENNNIVPGKAEKIIKTTIEKGLKITFDNGESITVTKDHPLMTRDGKYVQAQNLKVGDSMMPLYFKKGDNKFSTKKYIYNPGDGKYYGHAKLLMGLCGTNDVIIHLNGNRNDRRLANMVTTRIHNGKKWCTSCLKEKSISEFGKHKNGLDGYRAECNECKNLHSREYLKEHKAERKVYSDNYYQEHKEYVKQRTQKRRPQINERIRAKYRDDINFRLRNIMAGRITKAVRNQKHYRKWVDLLGYDIDDLKRTLEQKFTDGMNWNNYGNYIDENGNKQLGWEIDHIKPLNQFNITSYECEDFKRAWALDNLQPLWATSRNINGVEYLGNRNKNDSIYLNHKIKVIEEVGETQFYGVQNAAPYFNFAIAFEDGSGIFSKNTLVYSDYLRKAQMARAQRHAYPVELWKFGDIQNGYIPNDEELSSVREMLQKALTNPPYTIVYTPLLSLEVVSPAGGLLPIYDDYNFVENQILVGLGTNKNIVLGEGGWMSNAKTLSMQRLIMDYQIVRDMWTRTFLQNFVLRPMCIANGFTKKSLIDKTKDIANVPKIAWVNSLDVQNEEDTKKLYIDLWHDGLISSKTLYSQFPDLDFRTEVTQMQEEKGTVLDGAGRTLPATVTKIENEEKETEVKTEADEVNEKPIKPVKMDV